MHGSKGEHITKMAYTPTFATIEDADKKIAELTAQANNEQLRVEVLQREADEMQSAHNNTVDRLTDSIRNYQLEEQKAKTILDSINQEIKAANAELESIKEEIRVKQVNLEELKQIESEFLNKQEKLSQDKEKRLIELKEIFDSIEKQKATCQALEENLSSIIQITESASQKEKELLGKTEELQKGLQLLRDEEESQLVLTQQVKQKKEEVLSEIEELKAERHQLQSQTDQEKAKLKEVDEALLAKQAELNTVIGEINERLMTVTEAESRLQARIHNFDLRIKQAKADKLISETFSAI